MEKFVFKVTLIGAILSGQVATAQMPDNLTCLTYQMKQATDKLSGQMPSTEEWLNRVVAVENSVLFLHRLAQAEKNKIIVYYVSALDKEPSYITHITQLVDHLCMTKISDTERSWLADVLKREIGFKCEDL